MNRNQPIKPPSKKELFTLRLMIILGLLAMGFFLNTIFSEPVRGYGSLYWMLIVAFVFSCLKIVYEWCHYFYITVPETPPTTKTYTVDIFTTFCKGEPYEMIKETLLAINAITYPHKTYLCDEANDPYLINLCNELGINHVTRTDKKDAKAGNINNALNISTGELCVVLDPDHVPFPNFLDPIVSHFNNPEIGFVQVVQAYKNNDENLIAKGAAQQTYQFYGPIMMTMNKYGTVLAIGANCTFRRTALQSIGGHAAGLAEDMHTAMQLHSKGWKSVYVPEVLARGLVPSTISAYYKQQLKWSRGVFDLLLTAYPKLFKGFTWQQKLHYAIIPLHYLSGIIFLINFLIPILSLFFDLSPINIDLGNFGLAAIPLIVTTILIRHFVQWWVMEDDERGFHVVGGLIMIGTWWIFVLGLIYTIIGKKVPYVPTPKDGNEANNWPLNIPNLIVLGLSITAIIYGLNYDWNPHNLIMAGFATINCFILSFTIYASRQQQLEILKERHHRLKILLLQIKQVKINFWLMRRRIYTGVRSTALISTILLACVIIYILRFKSETDDKNPLHTYKDNFFLSGIFMPENFSGHSSIKSILAYQHRNTINFDIVSLYVPWGDQETSSLPIKEIDSIYQNGAVPMISWEPWQNLFTNATDDKKVFNRIIQGKYDQYLHKISGQLKTLKRPVFLRFAHEADNPFYPWSATGDNTPEEFKSAWKYLHDYFSKQSVYNVIWVWNPWNASAVDTYFPGKTYVDWIGVTNLNYGSLNSSKKWASMETLYQPFHQNPIFRSGLPVMLAEMGSLQSAQRQDEWLKAAFVAAKTKFPEIKSFVFFNSKFDKNAPQDNLSDTLNWDIQSPALLARLLNHRQSQDQKNATHFHDTLLTSYQQISTPFRQKDNAKFNHIQGINYFKAHNWLNSYTPLTKREIIADFQAIKQLGINSIKHYGPGIYDHNVLQLANKMSIAIHYGFWIPDDLNFLSDTQKLEDLNKEIIKTINKLKDNRAITSWNLGNPVLQQQQSYFFKPELVYQQDAYLVWIKKLVRQIKNIDPNRPISIDVKATENIAEIVDRMHKAIPEIDSYGLTIDEQSKTLEKIADLQAPYFFSSIPVASYIKLTNLKKGAFISSWQDEQTSDGLSFNGIKDYRGRSKFAQLQLLNLWKHKPVPMQTTKFKIMRPAVGTFPGTQLSYYALKYNKGQWSFINKDDNSLQYEWKLVKTNALNYSIDMKELGSGPDISVNIPDHPLNYRLYLFVLKDKIVIDIIKTTLNTPLPLKTK